MDLPVIVFVILLLLAALLFTIIVRRDVKYTAAPRRGLQRQPQHQHLRSPHADLSPPARARIAPSDDTH